jgi:hypothetical protein
MSMYGTTSYAMGADTATSIITKDQAVAAKRELARMKRSLTKWLHYRSINDQVAAGASAAVKSPLLKLPGANPPPAVVQKAKLASIRSDESTLALQLHQLLSEVFDAGQLPSPEGPNAAVALAQIAIAGKLPGESPTPTAVGFLWMWPAVIVVGGIVLVLTTLIRSNADVAMEKERLECIKAGKCTDTGFWLKVGAVGLVGWIAWDKAGLGHRVTGLFKKKGGKHRR